MAVFDTRIDMARVNSGLLRVFVNTLGCAAEPMAKALQKKGGKLVVPPGWFFFKDTEDPMEDGELERAAQWAKTLL